VQPEPLAFYLTLDERTTTEREEGIPLVAKVLIILLTYAANRHFNSSSLTIALSNLEPSNV
jgi:hypothetical protein